MIMNLAATNVPEKLANLNDSKAQHLPNLTGMESWWCGIRDGKDSPRQFSL